MENLVEGKNPILELLKSGRPVNKLLLSKDLKRDGTLSEVIELARKRTLPIEWVDKAALNRKSPTGKHQGMLAFASPKEYRDIEDILNAVKESEEKALIVVLDGIEDPQNLGAIIRSAEGAGVDGVVIAKRGAAGLTDAVTRSSAGAVEHVAVARVANIPETITKLKDEGVWVVGIEAGQGKKYYDVDLALPTAIVIGSEGKGFDQDLKRRSDSFCDGYE